MTSGKQRIAIINDGTGPNQGDRAILVSMLDCQRRIHPGVSISSFLSFSFECTYKLSLIQLTQLIPFTGREDECYYKKWDSFTWRMSKEVTAA